MLVGGGFGRMLVYFAALALVLTGILWVLPKYPEYEFLGSWLNNFAYFVALYLAARWVALGGIREK